MSVYYNEIDPFCCEWLRQLIKAGQLPDGEIDNRSIEDVCSDDLRGFKQCHFFAGIGGWPYAIRRAGLEDVDGLWTASCPCQPFSAAGKRAGTSDERHLWPAFFWLASQRRPDIIVGEQVASKDALAWFDLVRADLEGEGYAVGVSDTCAAGYGAPHIRQRLYWMAFARGARWRGRRSFVGHAQIAGSSSVDKLADSDGARREWNTEGAAIQGERAKRSGEHEESGQAGELSRGSKGHSRLDYAEGDGRDDEWSLGRSVDQRDGEGQRRFGTCGAGQTGGGMGDAEREGLQGQSKSDGGASGRQEHDRPVAETGYETSEPAMPTNGFWANPDWLWCRDKKWRPVISTFPLLVDGIPCALGYACSTDRAKEGIINALLPILREIIGTQEIRLWATRRFDAIQAKKILQSNLYGACNGKGCVRLCTPQPEESASDGGKLMRYLWGNREVTCASFERKPYRQYPIKFDDLVRFLPPQGSFAQFFGCQWTTKALQILWEACCENWPVLHTLGTFAPLWASLGEEDKNRLRLAISPGSWRALQIAPTRYVGAFERKRNQRQRLKGYGNAIVIPQAVAFLECIKELLDDSGV